MKKILILSALVLLLAAACKSKSSPSSVNNSPQGFVAPISTSAQKPIVSSSAAVNTALAAIPGAPGSLTPDCGSISRDQYISLGNGIMAWLAGDEAHHSKMEAAMGGENNDMTKSAHAKLGQLYLGCPINSAMATSSQSGETMATGTMTNSMAGSKTTGMMANGTMTKNVPGAMSDMDLVAIKRSADLGEYLTDTDGKTLYTFAKDAPGISNCLGQCLVAWPALTTTVASSQVSSMYRSLTVIKRSDGSMQLAWNGLPLYYYAQDKMAGDAMGQNVGGVWTIVSP